MIRVYATFNKLHRCKILNIINAKVKVKKLTNYSLDTTIVGNHFLVFLLSLKLFVCNMAT